MNAAYAYDIFQRNILQFIQGWHNTEIAQSRTSGIFILDTAYFTVIQSQNSKYKLEGKILHQQCNRLFPARCQTYAN